MRTEPLRKLAGLLQSNSVFLASLLLLSAHYLLDKPIHNEGDVLPLARQAVDPSWLPGDDYLNQPSGYRTVFDYTVGWLLRWLPFGTVAIIGRLITFVLMSLAFQALARVFELPAAWLVPALLVFVPINQQSLVAGEWMVGGLETKPFAYTCCLLALARLLQRRYAPAFFLLGLSLTFHVLVGTYATLCALAMMLVHWRLFREDGRQILAKAWWFLPSGALGLWFILSHLLVPDASPAAWIYVRFRLPHHVLPDSWLALTGSWFFGLLPRGYRWLVMFTLLTTAFLVVVLRHRDDRRRLTATFALASAALFAIGLGWFALGADAMLKFYWFRFGDTMLPFLGCFLAADLLHTLASRWRHGCWLMLPLGLASAALIIWTGWENIEEASKRSAENGLNFVTPRDRPLLEAQQWIREHTPQDAVFLANPFITEEFYLHAERALFVSFKHMPQSSPRAMVEWYERIRRFTAGWPAEPTGFYSRNDIRKHYRPLTAEQTLELAAQYRLTHVLVEAKTDPFKKGEGKVKEVYRTGKVQGNEGYVIYEVRD